MQIMSFETYKPNLFPRLEKIGAFIGSLVAHLQYAPERHSDHYRGAEEMLSQNLDTQQQLPFED